MVAQADDHYETTESAIRERGHAKEERDRIEREAKERSAAIDRKAEQERGKLALQQAADRGVLKQINERSISSLEIVQGLGIQSGVRAARRVPRRLLVRPPLDTGVDGGAP